MAHAAAACLLHLPACRLQDPDFQRLLRRYIAGCLQLGAAILRGISLGLKLPENYFEWEVAGERN